MNEFEDLTSRLKALGDNPVPPPVATQHLTAMAEVSAPRRFSQKLRIAAAFGVGIFVGGTGLGYAAAQDALPEQAQSAVEAAGKVVGLDIAKSKSNGKAGGQGGEGEEGDDTGAKGCRGAIVSAVAKNKAADTAGKDHGAAVKKAAEDARAACPNGDGEGEADLDDTEGDTDPADNGEAGKANGQEKKAENAPEETPAGPPAETPAGPPADLDVEGDEDDSDDSDDSGEEDVPGGGRPVSPGNAPEETPAP